MKINKNIIDSLKKIGVDIDEGITYLLSLYFGYAPSYIPLELKQKIDSINLVSIEGTGIKWNIPLFEGQEIAFDWVEREYVFLFARAGKDKYKREAVTRMKKLFSDNPEIRKEEVIGATEMYLSNTNSKYVRYPHFFIQKGSGVDKTQDILEWIDKYRLTRQDVNSPTVDKTKILY